MTLTFAVTLLATWILISIPVSLMIVSLMRVESDADEGRAAMSVEPALRESA